jgi:hypothetical protein
MPDSLSGYYAELRTEEDAWCRRHGGKGRVLGTSFWTSNLDRLREIDARHGVRPGDPRVYSIAAYLAESRGIEQEWLSLCEKRNSASVDPGAEDFREFWSMQTRLWARLDNCKARHFPGLNDLNPETIDTIPKLWAYIRLHLTAVCQAVHRDHPDPAGHRPLTCKKQAQRAYSAMHRVKIPWAREPPYPDFTPQEALDELTRIANRLEREDAERCERLAGAPGGASGSLSLTGVGEGDQAGRWMTVTQAARVACCNKGIIARAAKGGELRSNGKTGRDRRIDTVDLARWMLERAERPEASETDAAVQDRVNKHVRD